MPRDVEDRGDVGLQAPRVRREFTKRLWVGLDVLQPAHLHLLGQKAGVGDAFGERGPGVLFLVVGFALARLYCAREEIAL